MARTQQGEVGLAGAAKELGISWQRAWRLLLTGELDGHQRDGHWYVRTDSVAALKAATTTNVARE